MKKYLVPFCLIFLLFSCGGDDSKNKKDKKSAVKIGKADLSMQSDAVSFISNQDNVIAYGSIKMNQILDKGYYSSKIASSDVLNSAVAKEAISEIERIKSYVNMDIPMYYAVKGSDNIADFEFLIFGGINDRDALIDELKALPVEPFISNQKQYKLIEIPNASMAMTKDRFVLSLSPEDAKLNRRNIDRYFSLFKGKKNKKVDQVFARSKDATFAYDYGKLMDVVFNYLRTEGVEGMDPNIFRTMERLKEMDLTASMDIAFESGSISTQMNIYSSNMTEWEKLMGPNSKGIISKLGQGTPFAGFVANLNVEEYQKMFYEWYPEGIVNYLASLNLDEEIPYELLEMENTLREDGFKSFIGGEFGMMLYNIPNDIDNEIPEMSFYANIGENLKQLIDENPLPEMEENNMQIDVQNDRINIYSKNHAPNGSGPKMKSKLSHLGSKPVTGFIDLSQIPTNDLPRDLRDIRPIIEMLDFVDMEMDMTGGHLTLHFKDKSKNALTQIVDTVMEISMNLMTEGLFR